MAVIAKSVVAASAVAVGSTMALSDGALGTGQCTNVKQCSIWGPDYACISVDTKMAVKKASMCVPTNSKAGICSGLTSGLCPSFSAIPSLNNIETVCAFFPPTDGNKCVNKSIENQKGKLVDCKLWSPELNGSKLSETNGIYGCIDKNLYESDNVYSDVYGEDDGKQIIAEQMKACAGENDKLCSGSGTCVPVNAYSMNYTCACNKGYSGSNCSIADSNSCDIGGACKSGRCEDTPSGRQCACPDGTTGPQCSQCKDIGSESCTGHGSCNGGKCKCADGYTGNFCERLLPPPSTSTSDDGDDSGDNEGARSSPVIMAVGVVASTLVAAFL